MDRETHTHTQSERHTDRERSDRGNNSIDSIEYICMKAHFLNKQMIIFSHVLSRLSQVISHG